jgi:hypothetical protein
LLKPDFPQLSTSGSASYMPEIVIFYLGLVSAFKYEHNSTSRRVYMHKKWDKGLTDKWLKAFIEIQ